MEGSNLIAGYYAELDILCIILLSLLIIKTRKSNFISNQKRNFQVVLLCHIIFSLSDLIWVFNNRLVSLLEIFPVYGVVISYVINCLNVIFSVATGLAWMVFSETVQGKFITMERKMFAIVMLPFLIVTGLTVTTWQTKFMFYISEQGEFFRGPGYVVQVAVAMAYIIVPSVLAARRAKRAKTMQESKSLNAIACFIIAPICFSLLQLLLPKMQVMCLGTIVALISTYISLQEMQVITDPLTGLNNRVLLDQRFGAAVQAKNKDEHLYLMFIDADNFKKINDNYGHVAGDCALKAIADALRKSCNPSDYVCRYGGDEFIVLHRTQRGENCVQFVQKVNALLAACDTPFPVTVSIGFCQYTQDMECLDAILNAADEDLYRVKSGKKSGAVKGSKHTEHRGGR